MNTMQISIQHYIENQIPKVFLDYLCEIVQTEDFVGEIILTPIVLGTGAVQDIHYTTRAGTVLRRVFGFVPVDMRLQVSLHENQIELAIAG